jgi:hypothetical protein
LRAAEDGKKLPSTTSKLLTSWLRQLESRTLADGSLPATAVPHMWGVGRDAHPFGEHNRVAGLADCPADPLDELMMLGEVARGSS